MAKAFITTFIAISMLSACAQIKPPTRDLEATDDDRAQVQVNAGDFSGIVKVLDGYLTASW